jgi:DNA polymerase III epsilon subunit-like protein
VAAPGQADFAALALSDRAVRFLAERGDGIGDEELLAHVYGGAIPAALRTRMAAPLLADGRLERAADGRWRQRTTPQPAGAVQVFTALALAATGPTPGRARLVRICALHVAAETVVERFDALLNPGRRVPLYAAQRAGVEPEVLDGQPTFDQILGELARFLGQRPVLAQDVRLTWAFLEAEARRHEHVLIGPALLDVNDLATSLLDLKGKPTLAAIAANLGIGTLPIVEAGEEARVLALVGGRLLVLGAPQPVRGTAAATLRRGDTARALPDEPGVYVLRDSEERPLYVGKARRLRSRMAAYVHRPLGPTRRLEGLVGSVEAVDTTSCQTDLEALILEDREIRRLQPRFNTVRQSQAPRYWIRLPFARVDRRGKSLAPPRLELSAGPGTAEGEFVGPFRNEMLADQARQLAREVFELDELRRATSPFYAERLQQAWAFLHGESERAETLARQASLNLLRKVLQFDIRALLLPADPRLARYAVVRPGPSAVEGFLLDCAVLYGWTLLNDENDTLAFARRLLEATAPRTAAEDADVVLRWFGTQRAPARLICLPDDAQAATDAIEAAAAECLLLREA